MRCSAWLAFRYAEPRYRASLAQVRWYIAASLRVCRCRQLGPPCESTDCRTFSIGGISYSSKTETSRIISPQKSQRQSRCSFTVLFDIPEATKDSANGRIPSRRSRPYSKSSGIPIHRSGQSSKSGTTSASCILLFHPSRQVLPAMGESQGRP